MRRRAIFAVLFVGLAALAAAVAPWTLSSDVLRSAVSARFRELAGLGLSVNGRSVIAFLPVPRVKFENVTLTTLDGQPVARNGLLRAELRILPLLLARLEFTEVLLKDAIIDVDIDAAGRSAWDETVASLRERVATPGSHGHVGRIVLAGADLNLRDRRSGIATALRDVNLMARWPTADAPVDVTGSLTWRGQPVDVAKASFQPSAFAAGRSSRIDVQASAPPARLGISGDLSWTDAPRLLGRAVLETRSLDEFSRWSGLGLPLAHLVQAFTLDGTIDVNGANVSWPSARLSLAGDRLEGALSARLDGGRRVITATLAADRLDLTGFAAPLLQARTQAGDWSSEGIDLYGQGETDLDMRLSAASSRIGPVRLEDVAANISIKPGRYEASVGRASINKGVVKGRAILASAADGIEIKGNGSFEGLDVASLLTDLGVSRWMGGLAQGQLAFEGSGDTPAEIVRRLHGRASVAVQNGDVAGLPNDRRKTRSLFLSAGRSDRMPFDQAHVNVTVMDGTAEIADGGLTAAGLRAVLRGRASLPDRAVAARADVESDDLSSALVLDIRGPWENLAIVPTGSTQEPETTGSGRSAPVR
jgi:AsmA protein